MNRPMATRITDEPMDYRQGWSRPTLADVAGVVVGTLCLIPFLYALCVVLGVWP